MKTSKLSFLRYIAIVGMLFSEQSFADSSSEICQNQISLQLQEEGWVTSKTALVTVDIQAATSKDDSAELIQQMTDKLKNATTDHASLWKLVSLSTEKNSAGLLTVSATMSARLSSNQLTQLQTVITKLNKAGEQFSIQNIDYQPELSEISAEKTLLRQRIYHDVLEQQKVMDDVFVGNHYQLHSLEFNEPYVATNNTPRVFAVAAGNARVTDSSSGNATPYSQQLIMTANATFSSVNMACDNARR